MDSDGTHPHAEHAVCESRAVSARKGSNFVMGATMDPVADAVLVVVSERLLVSRGCGLVIKAGRARPFRLDVTLTICLKLSAMAFSAEPPSIQIGLEP